MIDARDFDEKRLEEEFLRDWLMRPFWAMVEESGKAIDRLYWQNGNGELGVFPKGGDGE